jgi:hypothetical protein
MTRPAIAAVWTPAAFAQRGPAALVPPVDLAAASSPAWPIDSVLPPPVEVADEDGETNCDQGRTVVLALGGAIVADEAEAAQALSVSDHRRAIDGEAVSLRARRGAQDGDEDEQHAPVRMVVVFW